MNKLIIRRREDGTIYSVDTIERYLTDKRTELDVLNMVYDFNAKAMSGTYKYEIVELDNQLIYSIVQFALGDGQYRHTKGVNDICDELESTKDGLLDVENTLDECSMAISDMKTQLERIEKMVKEKLSQES